VYIEKTNSEEKRPLGIPTIEDRARQALVLLALEPQWEAQFEANSYGFRPGRSAWDAIAAIFNLIRQKPKFVLDADIEKCFDRINHQALLKKINSSPSITRRIRAWLKAGVIFEGELFPTEEGTPQGGIISPLLANIALHGMEEMIRQAFPRQSPAVVRYADDLVVLHPDRSVIEKCQELLSNWLGELGLKLKPAKTRICHTLNGEQAGFDFLGFNIRQYRRKKARLGMKTIIKPASKSLRRHHKAIREVIRQHRASGQLRLIHRLNPVIVGWSRYYSTVCSKRAYSAADWKLLKRLRAWERRRHSRRTRRWTMARYWKREGKRLIFTPKGNSERLRFHSDTKIKRHVKVKGRRSPYEKDWMYWSARLGHHPEVSTRVGKLLKRQEGKCLRCGLRLREGERLEVDHIIPRSNGGRDGYCNWQLLHGHCHDEKTADDSRRCA
jgi:RNA-directed DNA polymerase